MMWTTRLNRVFSGVVVATLLAIPATVSGQRLVGAAMGGINLDRAEVLEGQAAVLLEEASGWQEAASLLRQAAALRPAADGQAAENLILAGKLAYFSGDALAAIVDLEGAGTRGVISDDPAMAARAYLDAAWVADQAGLKRHRSRLIAEVERIAQNDFLDEKQLKAIGSRVKTDTRELLTARHAGLGLYRTSN